MTIQTFLLAGVTSYADPGTWNNANNVVQCIGPGGSGSLRRTTARGGFGAGGGAHAAVGDLTPTFPVSTTIPAGTSQTKTQFGTTVIADFGKDGTTTAGGLGGSVAGCTGTAAYLFAGGAATYAGTGSVGGGGAGAGGPHGTGQASATTGGSAANGTTSPNPTASVAAGVAGRVGTQWDASHGAGSGAGGATLTGASTGIGLAGGAFGGGGSGCHSGYTGSTLGAGGDGLIAITREYASCRNYIPNSAFINAVIGALPSPHVVSFTGTGVSADVTSIGIDANGYPFVALRIHGGGGTGTFTNVFFGGNGVTLPVVPSVPMIASLYWRLSAGTLPTGFAGQIHIDEDAAGFVFLGQVNIAQANPTSTIARTSATGVMFATAAICNMSLTMGYTAGTAVDMTLELSCPQLELGDVVSAPLLTPAREMDYPYRSQTVPILGM